MFAEILLLLQRKKENVPIIHEDVAVGADRKRSSGSSSSVKGHVKGATITKADMLKEAKVRTSASESDSDMDVPPTDEDNNEVFVRPSAPLKEVPQISLPHTSTTELSSSGSVEAKETPMEVTKLPEIRRISPPPQEKSDVNSTVPPPLPVSPVPEELGSVKPEKRPSAESEDVSINYKWRAPLIYTLAFCFRNRERGLICWSLAPLQSLLLKPPLQHR